MCVAAYYTEVSSWTGEEQTSYDTHADSTITITNSLNSGVLAVGTNIISATTVCKDENGKALTIDDIIVTICANTDGTYTYIVSGIGYDGANYYTLDASGAVTTTKDPDSWPTEWSMYIFDGTKNGDGLFGVYVEGWFAVGTAAQVESYVGSANGATTGYWGYIDGTLTFVRGATNMSTYQTEYYICDMTTNEDGSVTISDSNGTAITGTIPNLGCLVGDGYNLSELTIVS